MAALGLKILAVRPKPSPMVGAVQMKLLSLELGTVRDALANAQAVSVQPGATEVQAEVILELSAQAQQLLKLPVY
jgi:hypothetical protein